MLNKKPRIPAAIQIPEALSFLEGYRNDLIAQSVSPHTRNAYLSIFSCPSTAKNGKISAIIPVASHMDHSEHSVQIVVTEQGVADLRGKDPHERAQLIIDNCAHPDYRDQLRDYLKLVGPGSHQPLSLSMGIAMHRQFLRHGDMRNINWDDC